MNPGRELDALIAEKVMGLEIVHLGEPSKPFVKNFTGTSEPTEYSTDIAAAWEVVERLKDSEHAFGFELTQDQGELCEWLAYFGEGRFKAESETAPHAICLAALKAVGYVHAITPEIPGN